MEVRSMANGTQTRRQFLGGMAAAMGGALAAACATGPQNSSTADVTKSLQPQSLEFWGPDPGTHVPTKAVVDAFTAKFPQLSVKVGGGALNITPESQAKFLT